MKLTSLFLILCSGLFAGQNSLGGVIQDENGVAMPGSSVYLETCDGTLVTVSGRDGVYAFDGLDDGDYQIYAWVYGKISPLKKMMVVGEQRQLCDVTMMPMEDSVDVSLKISPIGGADLALPLLTCEIDANVEAADTLKQPQVIAALKGLDCGEYELVLARPGSAYVGTFMVSSDSVGKTLLHTSGMVIEGSDYMQAVSDQVVAMAGQGN